MKYIIALVIIAVLLFYFFLPASKDEEASGKIEVVLNNLVKSGEQKNIDMVMEYFSLDYNDSSGRTYISVKEIIQSAFNRFEEIEGGYSNLIVSTTEDESGETQTISNINIWISGNKSGTKYKLIGTQENPKNVDITFERLMLGGWKILSIEGIK